MFSLLAVLVGGGFGRWGFDSPIAHYRAGRSSQPAPWLHDVRRGFYNGEAMKRLTKQERAMYEQFMDEFPTCMRCGWQPGVGYRGWMIHRLENAHILGGVSRTHHRSNLVRLCSGCHRTERETIRVEGKVLPMLTLAGKLWLKMTHDPEWYDVEYLVSISIKNTMPEPVEPPPLFAEPIPNWRV